MTLPRYPTPEPADAPDEVVTIGGEHSLSPAEIDEERAELTQKLTTIRDRAVTVTAADSAYSGASGPVVAITYFPAVEHALLFLDLTSSHGTVVRLGWDDTNVDDVWDTGSGTGTD